ncbi:hypothetical protein WJX72_009504 [[Myrmecia] bisecta]|uniref:Uncharacterized protein n=1 Tax=[Myrmecia] bisecta TaxID=41462 RepID=A0AAW1R8C1_9CHLO
MAGCTVWTPIAQAAETAAASTLGFTPGPVEVGWEIWAGAAAGVIPFIIGAWEFGKRIVIQRRCSVCSGSGLVSKGRYLRKCPECGGFFPWQGWRQFFTSTASPGNGGVLRAPKGQTSVFYKVPPATGSRQHMQRPTDGTEAGATVDAEASDTDAEGTGKLER